MKLKTENKSFVALRSLITALVIFAVIFLVAIIAINSVQVTRKAENAEIIENGVRRAAMECYASEGFFPDKIDYLIENYHLYTDNDHCIIHYSAVSSNIVPEIKVIPK
ncbi:MAG: hypothetical protein E7490_05945 [Ruminococcaceae bacterium]|nr:hypothetical protein [Oscillospiraceae bacterium]